MENVQASRRLGRPLSFDRDVALDKAMMLFWRSGYETTSLNDLTAALGVSPPSIYAAFGDKKGLFLEAVQRYVSGPQGPESLIGEAGSARDAAGALLEAAVVGFTGRKTPPGCLLATAAITGSPGAADIRAELAAIRLRIERALRRRIERGRREGETLPAIEPDTLAAFVVAIIQGMSTLARDGASRTKLRAVAAAAMRLWI